jgi:hypothetical protein
VNTGTMFLTCSEHRYLFLSSSEYRYHASHV